MPTRFLLVDDHALIREGLALALARVTEQVEVVEADSCEAALVRIAELEHELDLIVLDLQLPGKSRLEALAAIRAAAPSTPVVVLSGETSTELVHGALRAGARGYIPKSTPTAQLLSAVRLVFAGGTFLPPAVLEPPAQPVPAVIDESALTPRQRRVLAELARGAGTPEIAAALGIAEVTVRVHVATILRVLHVENRADAARSPLALRLRDAYAPVTPPSAAR